MCALCLCCKCVSALSLLITVTLTELVPCHHNQHVTQQQEAAGPREQWHQGGGEKRGDDWQEEGSQTQRAPPNGDRHPVKDSQLQPSSNVSSHPDTNSKPNLRHGPNSSPCSVPDHHHQYPNQHPHHNGSLPCLSPQTYPDICPRRAQQLGAQQRHAAPGEEEGQAQEGAVCRIMPQMFCHLRSAVGRLAKKTNVRRTSRHNTALCTQRLMDRIVLHQYPYRGMELFFEN